MIQTKQMKIDTLIKLSLIILLFAESLSAQENAPKGKIKITDGDTFSLSIKNKPVLKIRLVAIDAPEKKQEYGSKCTDKLKNLLKGNEIEIINYGTDRYGRTLGRVIRDGVDVNLEMVKIGCAWLYDDAKALTSDLQTVYKEAFENARSNKIGLFSKKSPIEPKEFRRQN